MNRRKKQYAGPLDQHIGTRMRVRRCLLGLSQQELAARIGLTFQQVQKYEKGQNRISASRLYDISQALNVELKYFYLDDENNWYENGNVAHLSSLGEGIPDDIFSRKETHKLMEYFYKINDASIRRSVLTVMENLSDK